MTNLETTGTPAPRAAANRPRRFGFGDRPWRMRGRRVTPPMGLVAVAVLAVLGYMVPTLVFGTHGMEVLLNGVLLGLMALSVGFLLNLLGWVSFGAAVFSGGGAYLFAILGVSSQMQLMTAAVLAVVGATLGAILIGLIFVRSRALVFTMLTLALGQLLLQFVSLDPLRKLTGGSDGLSVQYNGTLLGLSARQLADPVVFWPVVWTVALAAWALAQTVTKTRLGRMLRGIRENEPRMQHAGFGTYLPKLAAFGISGFLGAVAGVLQAVHTGFISPDLLGFGASGNAIIAALIGGYGSPFGAVLGGVLLIWGQGQFGAGGQLYLYTGIAVVVVISLFPQGIVGLLQSGWRQISHRLRRQKGVDDAVVD